MAAPEQIVRGKRVVTPAAIGPAAIHIRQGVISGVSRFDDLPKGCPIFEAGDSLVMPGLVDTHVHINEPGRAAWEGFETATWAAAAGGVTTLIDMPLNCIPATTTLAAFREKLAAAEGKVFVDVGFWGGVVPGNARELIPLWKSGVFGFKCFLAPSGVEEFPHVAEADLQKALPVLARLDATLLVHAELPAPLAKAARTALGRDPSLYRTWLASRPAAAETKAVELLVKLCRHFHARIHVVHLSSAAALPALRKAKRGGLPITVETCPHYLFFSSGEIPKGGTEFKCAPPIRGSKNKDGLWHGLRRGTIDFIVSDHSPCPPERKEKTSGNFLRAWGGISSLQLRLPVVWTEMKGRGFTLQHLVRWLCQAPARMAGLEGKKGTVQCGADADLVVWNPEETFAVIPDTLHHRHKLTPYARQKLSGVVDATFVRGKVVYSRGEFPGGPCGQILLRGKP